MLGYTIEVLFFANIWVYLYTTLLQILRLVFPAKPNLDFLILGVNPEPFEIPLYLITLALAILVIYLLHRKAKKTNITIHPFIKFSIFLILFLIFLRNLGEYPLEFEALQYRNEVNPSQKNLYLFFYFTTLMTFIIELKIIDLLIRSSKIKQLIVYSLVICIIAVVTFPPRFTISGVDYSYFYGPIWEIVKGKTIYTQVPSQYGFLSILFLSTLQKLNILSLSYLPVLVWVLFVFLYAICFYLISKISKSFIFGFVGLLAILTINFLTVRVIPTDYPQSGPLRWIPLIIALLLFYKNKNLTSYLSIFTISVLSFWVVDVGIELLLTYILSLTLFYIFREISLKKTLISIFLIFSSILIFFVAINAVHFLLGYQMINPLNIFNKLQQYSRSGFGMLPIESKTYFWFVILFYFASIIYFFKKTKNMNHNQQETRCKQYSNSKDSKFKLFDKLKFGNWDLFGKLGSWNLDFEKVLLLFSANLMLFASLYYVGRSHPAELYTISLFLLLNVFLLFGIFYQKVSKFKLKVIILIGLFTIFVFLPTYKRSGVLFNSINEKLRRFSQGDIFKPELDEVLQKKYKKEIGLINTNLPNKKIVIISGDDTYLFYLSGKENLLNDNSLVNILTKKDLAHSLQDVAKVCPKKIAGECRLFKTCPQTNLFSKAFYAWQPLILSEIQNLCRFKYEPIQCTDQLCIAEAK